MILDYFKVEDVTIDDAFYSEKEVEITADDI